MNIERPFVKNMKSQHVKTISPRSFLVAAFVVGMLLSSFTTQTFGQKEQAERATTRDTLATTGFMTKADVIDELDGTEDEYFYKLQAVPGKLTVTLEVEAYQTNAGAYLDLLNANGKPLMQTLLVQAINHGSDKSSQSIKLIKSQVVVIRIKGIKYGTSGSYPGSYKILLEGPAVKFDKAVPPNETGNEGGNPGAMELQQNGSNVTGTHRTSQGTFGLIEAHVNETILRFKLVRESGLQAGEVTLGADGRSFKGNINGLSVAGTFAPPQ